MLWVCLVNLRKSSSGGGGDPTTEAPPPRLSPHPCSSPPSLLQALTDGEPNSYTGSHVSFLVCVPHPQIPTNHFPLGYGAPSHHEAVLFNCCGGGDDGHHRGGDGAGRRLSKAGELSLQRIGTGPASPGSSQGKKTWSVSHLLLSLLRKGAEIHSRSRSALGPFLTPHIAPNNPSRSSGLAPCTCSLKCALPDSDMRSPASEFTEHPVVLRVGVGLWISCLLSPFPDYRLPGGRNLVHTHFLKKIYHLRVFKKILTIGFSPQPIT